MIDEKPIERKAVISSGVADSKYLISVPPKLKNIPAPIRQSAPIFSLL